MAENGQNSSGNSAWLGWVLALVLLILAAYLGSRDLRLKKQIDEDHSQIALLTTQAGKAQVLTDVLASPDAKLVTLGESKLPPLPVGHAAYLAKNGALVFVGSRLRALAANRSYELWLIPSTGKAPIAAGLFRPDAKGNASVVLPSLAAGTEAKSFIVTVEDAGGAATPTLPIVMSGEDSPSRQ
jgi:hypothetical protein